MQCMRERGRGVCLMFECLAGGHPEVALTNTRGHCQTTSNDPAAAAVRVSRRPAADTSATSSYRAAAARSNGSSDQLAQTVPVGFQRF